MARIAPEALEAIGIRTEVGSAGLNHPESVFHRPSQARVPRCVGGRLEDEPQSLLDQVPELAAAHRRLRFGLAIERVRKFDSCLHRGNTSSHKPI